MLLFLRETGGIPAAGSAAGDAPAEALLAEFRGWLAGERGLSATTVACYGKQARKFLTHLGEPLDTALWELDAGQVTSFMVGYCQGRNPESAKALVTAPFRGEGLETLRQLAEVVLDPWIDHRPMRIYDLHLVVGVSVGRFQ